MDSAEDLIGQNSMLSSETKRRIDAARDILVGKLPLPTDQVELITLSLIYKFMDDLDEQSVQLGGKRSYFIKDLEPYRWRTLLSQKISGTDRVNLFKDGIEALGDAKTAKHLPELFRDVFRNAMLKFRDGQTLTLFLTQIDGFTYSHSEELGNAFEYLLQTMGIQGDNGQFRTPRHIIDFIVDILEPTPEDKILDPACGTGGFLVSAYKHILAKHTSKDSAVPGDQLTPAKREKISKNIVGYDITPLMVKLSEVNLFLHGFSAPDIHEYDTLSNDARWNDKYDLILANPPFMTPKGGVTPHNKFRVTAKKAEVLFTDYIAEHLTTNGRAGIIVPDGIVFRAQTAYVKLRQFLIEDSLVAVITLPSGVFKPYSGVSTSILILDKTLASRKKEILFIKVTADGFDLGDKRTPIQENDLPEAAKVVRSWLKKDQPKTPETNLKWLTTTREELLQHRISSLNPRGFIETVDGNNTEYEEILIGDICEILDSKRKPITKAERKAGPFPYYGATGCLDYVEGYLFDEPLVLVGEDGAEWGANQKCAYAIHGKTWVNNHAHVLRPDRSKILDTYLIEVLNRKDLNEYITGSTVRKLNQANLREIRIPLPSLETQTEIVTEIESCQKVIDGARSVIENYKPQIPIDPKWPVHELRDVCKIGRGFAFKSEDYTTEGILNFRVTNIGKNRLPDLSDPVYLPKHFLADYSDYALREGDIVIVMVGATTGKIGLITKDILPALLNQNMWRFFPDESVLLKKYFYFALEQLPLFRQGGARDFLRQSDFLENKLAIPPLKKQVELVQELEKEQEMVDANKELMARFEKKIQAVMDRVWGNGTGE